MTINLVISEQLAVWARLPTLIIALVGWATFVYHSTGCVLGYLVYHSTGCVLGYLFYHSTGCVVGYLVV